MEGTQPKAQSSYWVVPSPPSGFRVYLGEDGKPQITFTGRESFARYQLYRHKDGEDAQLIKTWEGKGAVTYEDTAALPGCTYTYYVLPVHREMQVGGEQVKGPTTQEITVTTPEAVIDVEIPAPSPHVDSSPPPPFVWMN